MAKSLISKNFTAILQTVAAAVIIAALGGIYEKLGKLDLIQDRQDRQGQQIAEIAKIQSDQGIELAALSAAQSYHEEQIKRLQDREERK